jgi:KaiC/GvpD/RAD55 family RecA-like ATPase
LALSPTHELRAIPEAILEFFRSALGQSLIVKGESGTGKTTFVTSLLEDLLLERFEMKHYIFVTSRIPSKFLSSQFTSFKAAILPDSIIDATRFVKEKIDETSLVVTDDISFIKLLKKWIGKIKYPLIVIDTIEALANRIGTDAISLVGLLIELVHEKDAKIVLVSERNEPSPLDHVVDGIVILTMKDEADHIDRNIHIQKLRGTSIGSGNQRFTLYNNRFCKLWSVEIDSLRKMKSFKVKPHSSTRFFTGLSGLDEITGGFRLGSTCFLEVESGIGNEIVNAIVLSTISNFMNQNGGVFMIPPNKMSYRTIKSAALRYDFIDHLNTNLRLLTYQFADSNVSTEKPEVMESYWKPVKINTSEELEKQMDLEITELHDLGCKDNLLVLGLGFLKSWLGSKTLDRWAMRAATMSAEDSGLALLIGYDSTSEVNPAMADVADIHLSLSANSDAVLFRGIHPNTPYYSIYTYEKDGGIHIGFQEIA